MQADGCSHIVRFVEALQQGTDSWLVFLDEGLSLHQLMYAPDGGARAPAGTPGDPQKPSDRWDAGLICHLRLLVEWSLLYQTGGAGLSRRRLSAALTATHGCLGASVSIFDTRG